MALTSAQLVTLACQAAGTTGWTSQAGQLLNVILQDLCQTYDFDICKGTYSNVFNVGIVANAEFPQIQAGSGPYALPTDFLRFVRDEAIWWLQGVPYPMIPVDLAEFDWMVQQSGNQAFPYLFATDMSQSPPLLVVWPGASGAYQFTFRYQRQQADVGSNVAPVNGNTWNPGAALPEVSTVVPWFPNQTYLLRRLTGELLVLADDPRAAAYLGEGSDGAQTVLKRFLLLKDDSSNRAKRVTLERRRFSRPWSSLPDTKKVGW